jgi:hypothetical protein
MSLQVELDALTTWIGGLPDVTSGAHRFGGTEFKVEGVEFMHFHGSRHLDIRLSKREQAEVLAAGNAERHMFAPEAGWVTFKIRSEEDIGKAKEIIQLAYKNAKGIIERHRTRRSR